MFLNVSMSMRSFWWIQLYLHFFQHLSFHNLFHLVHGEVHYEANMYLQTSQGAQNYDTYSILLNLPLGGQTFMYQKNKFFQLSLRHPSLEPACLPFLKYFSPPVYSISLPFKVFQTVYPTLMQTTPLPLSITQHNNLSYT